MATNTAASSTTHTGNGSTAAFSISFSYISTAEIDVTVAGTLKTLGTHYTISGATLTFTSGNIPANGAAIKFQRDTDISAKKVDFEDGSVLTEFDLDTNSDQVLFAQQEIIDKLAGIEEGATADQTAAEIKTLIASSPLDASHLAANSVDSSELVDGSVDTSHLSADSVTNAKIADDSIDSEHYVDGSIDTAHIGDSQITTAKIASDAVTSGKLNDQAVTSPKIANSNITTVKIADDAVTTDKIADNAVTSAKIANNAITTDKIADAELTTLAGMQSGTASKLADSTALTSDIADLNQLDGMAKQTSITDDDTKFPTSGAVVDFVAAQIAPIGGLEVIANEDSFPTTQPASGVVVSISDVEGLIVNGSGVATNARTSGNGSDNVTINGFPSSLQSKTMAAGVGLMVSSTGSSQTYTYHKLLAKEADVEQLSNDINDFAARYRVTNGEPTSDNDEGDLIYDKDADKMKVFDSTTNAFKEVTSVGDYKFLFLCPAGGTGSPTINGNIATYDLREGSTSGSAATVTNAAQLIVSINGVIQKPNTGTSAPSEGFAMVDSNTIIFGSNLPTGASIFIIQIGSATTLNVPADNSVSTAKLQSAAVTTAKIADNAVTSAKLALFTQTGTGATARTIDSKLKEILHFKDFGAVGDGSTNDATALLAALNAATGKILDGGGLTYKCNSMLAPTSENIVVQNATFDFSGVTTSGNTANAYISFTGSVGTPTAVAADINVGDNTFTVASTTGLTTPNSYHILEDDQVVTSSEGLTLGQYIFIKEVNTTSKLVTLHNDILYKFLAASNAQVVPVTMKKNITFKNVIIKGANPAGTTTSNTHTGLRFRRCEGVTLENCTLEDIDYAGSVIDASVNVKISNCTCKHHTKTGTSYGFVIGNASYGVNIVNSYGQDLRHFVTIGDNEGINLFINVTNCHITGCRDAGIDSHSGGDFVNFSGNTIEGSSFDSGQLDGIIFQGINCIINDNVIVGIRRHAIHHQPIYNFAAASGGTASSVISGNKIVNHGDASSNEAGVLVFNHSNVLGTIDGVVIANNVIEGTSNTGISVYASGGAINNIVITGNNINHHNVQGILIRSGTDSGETIKNFNVTGNIVNCSSGASGAEGIYIFGNSTNGISNGTVTGNVVDMKDPASSGTHSNNSTAIRLDHTDHTMVSSNVVVDAKTFINPTSATSDNVYANNIDNSPDN